MSFVVKVEKDEKPSPSGSSPASPPIAVEQLQFVVGNPRVMVTSGVLHLFRACDDDNAASPESADSGAMEAKSEPAGLEDDRLPCERGTQVCCIAVPSHFGVSDFVAFTGSFVEHIKAIRILRDTKPYCYMALVSFAETDEGQQHADAFFLEYQGRLFNTMEERERCKLVFVAKVEIEGESDVDHSLAAGSDVRSGSHAAPGAGVKPIANADADAPDQERDSKPGNVNDGVMIEVPRCPVCLDRLDPSATGVLTTVCNHTFHCSCLRG